MGEWRSCAKMSEELEEDVAAVMRFSGFGKTCKSRFHLTCHLKLTVLVTVQWNLRIKDTLGAELLSSFWRLSFGGKSEQP